MSSRYTSALTDNTRLYKLLGIEKDATPNVIKKAFHKLSIKYHPDKWQPKLNNKQCEEPFKLLLIYFPHYTKEEFYSSASKTWNIEKLREELDTLYKDITKAYEWLMNERDRQIYDTQGEKAVEIAKSTNYTSQSYATSRTAPMNMFRTGGYSSTYETRSSRDRRVGRDQEQKISVTLEELYTGGPRTEVVEIDKKCDVCDGSGSKTKKREQCTDCYGSDHCRSCSGEGTVVSQENKCENCRGSGVVPEKKAFEIEIEAGMGNNDKITKKNEGPFKRNTVKRDLVFVIQQEKHPDFEREGDFGMNLRYKRRITLLESLLGVAFKIKTLSGEYFDIKVCKPISHGWVHAIKNAGMPRNKRSQKGDLLIEFHVDLPPEDFFFEERQKTQIRMMLVGSNGRKDPIPDGRTSTIILKDSETNLEDIISHEDNSTHPSRVSSTKSSTRRRSLKKEQNGDIPDKFDSDNCKTQ